MIASRPKNEQAQLQRIHFHSARRQIEPAWLAAALGVVAAIGTTRCAPPVDDFESVRAAAGRSAPRASRIDTAAIKTVRTEDKEIIAGENRRAWARERSATHSGEEPDKMANGHREFLKHIVARARVRGIDVNTDPKLKLLELESRTRKPFSHEPLDTSGADSSRGEPVPGGVGYGVYYDDDAFAWRRWTMLHERLIAPRTAGGDVADWLYNTATNRSNLGVEAYLAYLGQGDVWFKVFDWAKDAASEDPFVLTLDYADLADYLSNARCHDGIWRPEIEVRNYTFQHSDDPNRWINRVLLLNRQTGGWDTIYDYAYETARPTDNTHEAGEHYGSWAPIFETFQDHNGTNKPIGTNSTRLAQDGRWAGDLTEANANLHINDRDLDPPIFLNELGAWAVGSTAGEVAPQVAEAETARHDVGAADGAGWKAVPGSGSGWLMWGDDFGALTAGKDYAVQIDLKVDRLDDAEGNVAMYGVYDYNAHDWRYFKRIPLSAFARAGVYLPFRFELTAAGNERLAPFVYYYNRSRVSVARATLVLN